jgi:DinB superfamily
LKRGSTTSPVFPMARRAPNPKALASVTGVAIPTLIGVWVESSVQDGAERPLIMTHEHCTACPFDGADYNDASLLDALRGQGPRWQALLAAAGPVLRIRPAVGVWSAIEYAAHTRDILSLHVFGVEQALTIDEPVFPPIDDDLVESAAANYGESDPDEVVAELTAQGWLLADLAQDAPSNDWSRGLTIGDSRSNVRRLLEHALHDSIHHLGDVERGFTALRG